VSIAQARLDSIAYWHLARQQRHIAVVAALHWTRYRVGVMLMGYIVMAGQGNVGEVELGKVA
jgi:hypothetical protein